MTRLAMHHERRGRYFAEALAVWERDGLAVTPTNGTRRSGAWSVTHTASGYAAALGMRTTERAIQVAQALLELGDWTRSKDEVMADQHIQDGVKALRKRIFEENW